MRAGQARALGLDILAERLADCESAQLYALQVAAQKPQQVDEVARAVALLHRWPSSLLAQQTQQPPLGLPGVPTSLDQPVHGRTSDQPFLAPAHVVLCRRLQQRLAEQAV